MNLSMLNMDSFQTWLQNAEVECKPCDDQQCVLAKWLNDEGFPNARVDGETIYLQGDDSNPEDDEQLECPKWAEAVVTCFDGMAQKPIQLHMSGQTPIGPEVYKVPLVTLLNSIRQAEKAVRDAQAAL